MKNRVIIVLAVTLIFSTAVALINNMQAEKRKFINDASEVIIKLEQIDRGLDVGYNISEFRAIIR